MPLSPLHGKLVPADERCAFCHRGPRKGEVYGTEPKDWDAPGHICPECFPKQEPPTFTYCKCGHEEESHATDAPEGEQECLEEGCDCRNFEPEEET